MRGPGTTREGAENARKIGILGGTFNPIHIGHLMLAEWALDEIGLDQVWMVPTGMPYMKDSQEVLPGPERLHMTRLAVEDNPRLKCLDIEVRRAGRTYSYETLEELGRQYPTDRFFFIVGADCLFTIESWKEPERIFGSSVLVAAVRGEQDFSEMEEKKKALEGKFRAGQGILLLPFPRLSVSSTEIRERVQRGRSVKYLVPDRVLEYIREKGFYREKNV